MLLNGAATIELFRDGKCIKRMNRHNLVVTLGEEFYTQSILSGAPARKIRFIGLGRGATAATSGDVGLATALTSFTKCDTAAASGRTAVFVKTWTSTLSATGIREAGLFCHPTSGSGTMLARVVFTATTIGTGDSFKITWRISANDDGI